MPTLDIKGLTINAARRLLDEKEVSALELTQAYLDRIISVEEDVHSFDSVTADIALEQAKVADRMSMGSSLGFPCSSRII